MQTYLCRVDVDGRAFQNPQEYVSIWGDIRRDIEAAGGEVTETYGVLGQYDFLVVFQVADEETAFQVTQVIERHGLDTSTDHALPVDRLGELVQDI